MKRQKKIPRNLLLISEVLISLMFIYGPIFSQVNLQTGSAVFSLPMFNWQDDKSRLNSVVALSYSSGNGLRVNDVASNVGQGWNLVAGGVITRLQVGEPDDQIAYGGSTQFYAANSDQDITRYPAGYLYAGVLPATGCPNALINYPTYGARNVLYKQHNPVAADRQLDYFSFQFNGKSGQFVLDTAGGDHGVMLGNSSIKITFSRDPTMTSQGIRTTITSFTIQDVDGLLYKFTTHGLTKVLTSTFSNGDGTQPQTQPKISNNGVYCQSAFDQGPTSSPWVNKYIANPFIISSWYLTEIDDPLVSRKVLFTYNTLYTTPAAGADISYTNGSENYIVISYKKAITYNQDLSSITFPDGHLVNFVYSTTQRADYPGEFPLSKVNISYSGRYLSQYQLNTSYFILNRCGTPTIKDKSAARLCLSSVKKIGVDLKEDTPPYLFDYYTGNASDPLNTDDVVPPPFSYAKDIWGYYNGNNSIKYTNPTTPISLTAANPYQLDYPSLQGLCFQNVNVTGTYYNPKPGFAQNGLLKTITYPTGGSLKYQYTQNSGSFIGSTTAMNMGGVHVSQTSSYDGGYSNGCSTPVTTQYNYVVNGIGSASSLWGLEAPMNSIVSNNYYKEERQTIHFSLSNLLGQCLWHYVYPGILSQNESISLDELQKIMNAIAPVLGVLSIISDVMDVVNIISSFNPLTVIAVVLDVISAVLSYIISCPQATKNTYATLYYDFDLNESSPLPAQFKRVEITESPGTIGKTVEQFTNGDASDPNEDYPLWDQPENNLALSVKQRYAPWAYGLPKLITQYDVNNNKIKETQNVYDYGPAQVLVQDLIAGTCNNPKMGQTWQSLQSCRCEIINNRSERSDHWMSNVPGTYATSSTGDMNVDIYNTYTGHVNLKNSYERVYRTTDVTQFVQTETDYYYNYGDNCSIRGNYDVNQIVTTLSNGEKSYKNIKYTTDYNTGVLATMVQNNMVSVPVETNSYVINSALSVDLNLSEKVTEFTTLADNDIKPSRIIEQRFATPPSSIVLYSGPTTTNYSIYKIPETFTYDANSNLTGLKDEGGRVVTNIYDYNDKYIVASIINADPVADKSAYTSFESQDLSRSGWTLSGSASYLANATSPTGGNVFVLQASGANTLTASSLNTAKPYILSFWSNVETVNISPACTLAKSAPTYAGYTYYEYNVPAGTATVTIKNSSTGTINLDELRLYPSTARIRTTTYDPLIGKTSECDENNRITYYTYDSLGRMRFVEDEARNVVKMYEYNNVSAAKQIGCQVTDSSHAISEIFTKACSAGYQGSNVTYQLPAGKYTSIISQWDADIQAEIDILTNGQNYANTNGSCSLLYYNVAESETDTTSSCAPGYVGGPVTYTVPAGRDSSIISQADANQQALNDIAANAWAYVNAPGNSNCVLSTAPDWEWSVADSTDAAGASYCLSVNGVLPPHLFLLAVDVNPNSPSYNQQQAYDYGTSSQCAANTYYSNSKSQAFTRNNCSAGYSGSSVTYTVPPGKYNSTTSQAAADQQATNDVTANGQNYANANGTCTSTLTINGITYFSASKTSSSGTITGYPGITVTVTITASGPQVPSKSYSLITGITGATTTGVTSVTNGTTSYTFVMPASGSVTWSGTFSETTTDGSGSISVH